MSRYSFKHKNERPWPNERLGLGVIIGHTSPSVARIWVRTNDERAKSGDYRLLVFNQDEKAGGRVTKGALFEKLRTRPRVLGSELTPFGPHGIPATGQRHDTTAVLDVPVKPGVWYSYAIWSAREKAFVLGHDKRRRFHAPTERGNFAFGVFSCHNPFGKPEEIDSKIGVRKQPKLHNMGLWDTARLAFENDHDGANVDFLIAGGDQAYCDGCDAVNIWKYLEKILMERKKKPGSSNPLPTKEDMVSWFREMYRGYWGFPSVRAVLGRFPTYMIWDDHEIRDGWGSHKINSAQKNELHEVLFKDWKKYISYEEAISIVQDMVAAATQVYSEYQHNHNPKTKSGVFDYSFQHKNSLIYVLDGRGHRDFERKNYKILGEEQMGRFRKKVEAVNPEVTPVLFVVSAVPLLHARCWVGDKIVNLVKSKIHVTDDLRDAWEHPAHKHEREELTDVLFQAASRGIKVCVLSGDVHMSAVFRMKRRDAVIYQLTSSAITYNTPSMLGWFREKIELDSRGKTAEGDSYRRLLLESEPSFAIVVVTGENVRYQLYREQHLEVFKDQRIPGQGYSMADTEKIRMPHSAVKIDLDFSA